MSDIEKPLSYLSWIRSVDTANIANTQLFDIYNEYVLKWYKEKKKEATHFSDFRSNLFQDLLTEIAINYSSEEERQFLSRVDMTNRAELDLVVPFFVKRLKEISLYLITKRHQLQTAKQKKTVKGSELGVFTDVKHKIINPLSDSNFVSKYPTSKIPAISSVTDYIYVELEPLIDEYDSYFDGTHDFDIKEYVNSDTEYIAAFKSSTEKIDKNIWLDLTSAVKNLIAEKVPVVMEVNEALNDPALANTSNFLDIELNYERSDINLLPESEFVDQIKQSSSLNIEHEKKLIEKYSGTRMLYLSTGSTVSDFVSGVLFDPVHKSANYLNRYNAAHPSVPSTKFLKTEKDVGKFFTPEKQGLLNFERLDSFIDLDMSALSANTCYIYPDIEDYETGRGGSLTDSSLIYRYIDDNTAVKGSKSNPYIEGDITNDARVHKFYPYQSVEETQQLQNLGISRWSDDVDFWEGDSKDVWANNDVYKKFPLQDFPVQDKQDDLLVGDKNLTQWATDIYGNEFALFKVNRPSRKNTQQSAGTYSIHPIHNAGDTTISSTTGSFDYPPTKYFDHQLSGASTTFESVFNSLTSTKSIYDDSELTTAQFHFRNSRSTIISPVSSALSAVYVKYSQDAVIKSEIDNDVVFFDIKGDVIILQTSNYLILEKYQYSVDTDTFTSVLPFKVIVSVNDTSSSYEKIAAYWYDEFNNNFYIGKTVIHPFLSGSNSKAIYPEIYVYNDDNITFTKSFGLETMAPPTSSARYLQDNIEEAYQLLNSKGFTISSPYIPVSVASGVTVNITSIDSPLISINSREYTMLLTYAGYDSGDRQYIFNQYFDTRDFKHLSIKQLDLFSPNSNIFNHNFVHYNTLITVNDTLTYTLSTYIQSETLNRGSLDHKIVTIDGFKSDLTINVADTLRLFPMVFGTAACSGRPTNPGGYIDTTSNTVRMGAGLSASPYEPQSSPDTTEEGGTSIQPYTHNTSYLLLNAPLSGMENEIVVTFDVALYTITTENSAYGQIAS